MATNTSKSILDEWQYLLGIAYERALESPDTSTQNAAVIQVEYDIIGACNNFLPGVAITPERLERPAKYHWIEHAERAVIFKALNLGHSLKGRTLICPWFACHDCARAIIQVGIKRVVGHRPMLDGTPDHWLDSINSAFIMLDEAGVEQVWYEGPIEATPILFNGELFDPSKELLRGNQPAH